VLDGEVHCQVTTPRMTHHINLVEAGGVQDRDHVRYMLVDVEWPGRRGGLKSALLEPDGGELSGELCRERRGVFREPWPAVQNERRRTSPGLPSADCATGDIDVELNGSGLLKLRANC
jgi:hypothetical protein